MSASQLCRCRRISACMRWRQSSASSLLLLGHKVDSAADNRSCDVRYGFSGEHCVESIPEVGLSHYGSPLVEVFDAIVDSAEVEHLSKARKHRYFGRCCRSSEPHEKLLWVEQHRERKAELPGMTANFRFCNSRVGLHGVERHAATRVVFPDAVHLWNIAVAERAVRGREENHNGRRLRPIILAVNRAVGIPQGKLRHSHHNSRYHHAPAFRSTRHKSRKAGA